MRAALRDPSPFAKPDTRTERKYHVADGEGHPVCHLATVLDAATIVNPSDVEEYRQCERDACAMAFAMAGAQ
jgi:predicted RNA-binding Zn ribbon-like protein